MPGTLVITTLSDGTNSTSATNLVKAPCVAWANFNGTTTSGACTVRGSYNISSITASGVGLFTINFTSALTDANYSVVASISVSASSDPTTAAVFTSGSLTPVAGSASSFQMFCYARGVTNVAPNYVCIAVFR
jgi:hypothetical protein